MAVEFRIIPARAGFTTSTSAPLSLPTDHPRSRGVYSHYPPCENSYPGSSPLARGLRGRPRPERRSGGDHPRSRGVYRKDLTMNHWLCGSSPLARGLPRRAGLRPGAQRIIPARAGFTPARPAQGADRGDHPRSRGVYTALLRLFRGVFGSSPLARGLLENRERWAQIVGIIPARAGFTHEPGARERAHRDHPRSRGVYCPS